MDVDALSIKAHEEAMRKKACFGCGEIEHEMWLRIDIFMIIF